MEMSNAMRATSLLHTILRDRYPMFNIFADTSADPDGPCRVEMFDDIDPIQVAISQADNGVVVYTLSGTNTLKLYITPDKLFAEIAKLVVA